MVPRGKTTTISLAALTALMAQTAAMALDDIRPAIAAPAAVPPSAAAKHPLLHKATAPARFAYKHGVRPVAKVTVAPVFTTCCWIGKKSDETGFTKFLNLCGATAGAVAAASIVGRKI
jgi:hypothetical protein